MSRVIEFRGKRVSDGSYVYGQVIKGKNNAFIIENPDYFDFSEESDWLMFAYYIEVKKDSIEQYTGTETESGQPIYEGDTLRVTIEEDTNGEGATKEYYTWVTVYFDKGCFYAGSWLLNDLIKEYGELVIK